MAEKKKYYWLKLKRDFFKRHDIRIVESMPNGKDYILFYLKLLLESIDHEGTLRFSETIPYNEQMLSVVTNTNIDTVRSAMKLFIELNMMTVFDDQTIYMNEVDKLIGSESSSAERVRKHRALKGNSLQSNTLVTKGNTEIEKDKEIDKDTDTDLDTEVEIEEKKEFHSFIHSSGIVNDEVASKESVKMRYIGGSLGQGVVLMSDEQFDDLCDRLSVDEVDKYIAIVAECEQSGQHFKRKSHYQAILDMVEKDRKVKK